MIQNICYKSVHLLNKKKLSMSRESFSFGVIFVDIIHRFIILFINISS